MLTAISEGLATASLFSVLQRFVDRFLVRPFTTLGGSCSQPFPCIVGTGGEWEVSRHSTDGWTRLACDSLCRDILRCGAPPVSCARPKSNRQQACTSGCIGSTNIRGDVSNEPQAQKIIRNSVLHQQAEALARVDPLAGAPALNACLLEHASSTVRKAREGSGPGSFGCPDPFFLVDSAKL